MDEPTEYGGHQNLEAGVQPKNPGALQAWEKLRLAYLTGEPENPQAKRDGGRAWTGQSGRTSTTSGI